MVLSLGLICVYCVGLYLVLGLYFNARFCDLGLGFVICGFDCLSAVLLGNLVVLGWLLFAVVLASWGGGWVV